MCDSSLSHVTTSTTNYHELHITEFSVCSCTTYHIIWVRILPLSQFTIHWLLIMHTTPPRFRVYLLLAIRIKANTTALARLFFVQEKEWWLRPCTDYRGLNKLTVKCRYPLPQLWNSLLMPHCNTGDSEAPWGSCMMFRVAPLARESKAPPVLHTALKNVE